MSAILILIYCICAGGTTAVLTKRSFGRVFPLTLVCNSLILTLSGILCGSLPPGYFAGVLWAVLFVPVSIYFLLFKKDIARIRKYLITPSFAAFCMIWFLVSIMDLDAVYQGWDEYSHWGPMVKVMLQENRLYAESASSFAHHDYPPAAQLFEYFICRMTGVPKEGNVYRALQILTLSFLLPLFDWIHAGDRKRKRLTRVFNTLLEVSTLLMLILTGFILVKKHMSLFGSIYLDLLLAVCGGSLLLAGYGYTFTIQDAVVLGILSAFLLMTKQMGIFFVLLTLLLLMIRWLLRDGISRRVSRQSVIRLAVIIGIPAIYHELWSGLTRRLDLGGQFNISLMAGNAIGFLRGTRVLPWQMPTLLAFLKGMVQIPITRQAPASYLFFFLLYLTGMIFLLKVIRRWNRSSLRRDAATLAVVAAGYLLYAIVMLGLYLFGGFSEYEAVNLASFNRYMGTYAVASMIVLAGIGISRLGCAARGEEVGNRTQPESGNPNGSVAANTQAPGNGSDGLPLHIRQDAALAAVNLVFYLMFLGTCIGRYDLGVLNYIRPDRENAEDLSFRAQARKLSLAVKQDEDVLIIAQGDDGEDANHLNYYLIPVRMGSLSVGTPDEGDIWKRQMTPEELEQQVSEYDYLYLFRTDEEFNSVYAPELRIDHPEDGQLYQVHAGVNGIELTQIP